MDWSEAILSFVMFFNAVCCWKHPVLLTVVGNTLCYWQLETLCVIDSCWKHSVLLTDETYRWEQNVCHVTSAHGLSIRCGTVHCYESLFCVALSFPLLKVFCVCKLWYAVLHVQEGLINVTWHKQTPFLYSLILCTLCTPYRIVSYENWFPVPSNTFQEFSTVPLAIQAVHNNKLSRTRKKKVLINLTRRWRHTKQGFVTMYCNTHKDRPMSNGHTSTNHLYVSKQILLCQ